MRLIPSPFTVLLPLVLLAGCASPDVGYSTATPEGVESEARRQEQMVRYGRAQPEDRAPVSFSTRLPPLQRLTAVAERVLISAAPYCAQNLMAAYPVSVGTPDRGPPVVVNATEALRPGDRIVAVDNQPVPRGLQGFIALNRYGGQQAAAGQPLRLTAQRGGRALNAIYSPVSACNYDVILEDNGQWNAYADGHTIHVEKLLLQNMMNDDDLAFVLSHELSHNLLGHVGKRQQNVAIGAATGLAIEAVLSGLGGGKMSGDLARAGAGFGGMTYSRDFEREADYVGLYILATTGYDLDAGPRVARAIARQDARSIRYASSHPSSAERAAALLSTIDEIHEKGRTGQPLQPNRAH